MFRIIALCANEMYIQYDVDDDELDDEIDELCQDDFIVNFKYRRINDDGTIFEY